MVDYKKSGPKLGYKQTLEHKKAISEGIKAHWVKRRAKRAAEQKLLAELLAERQARKKED